MKTKATPYNIRSMAAWLWRTSKGIRLQSCLNAATGIAQVALDFSFIFATKAIIDIATGRRQDSLAVASVALVVIVALRISLSAFARWVSAILGVRSQNRLQMRVFSHLMRSQWEGLEQKHSGDVLNRLERDVRDITNTITDTVPSAVAVCVRLAGAFLFLYSMDRRLALVLVCISPLFAVLSKVYIRRMRRISREIRHTDSLIQSTLQESIQHRMVLKTLERCGTMEEKLDNTQAHLREQIRRRTLFSNFSATLLGTGFSLGYLVTFLWGAARLEEGTITYGTMLAFIQLVGQIQSPFRDISRFIPLIIGSLTASERLMELEQYPLEEDGEPVTFPRGAGIRCTDVKYAYGKAQREVLDGFSFDFPIGSTTAILGETGAGKTTLIRLILALLKPQHGTVEIYDGDRSVAVSPMTRNNLVYVPQGNTLFSGTVRDNLLLGNPLATTEDMHEALHTACADFVLGLPEGLDFVCGEQGGGLSEGQCQRIAIARALLRKGSILLLDEATSALDTDTERHLLNNLQRRTASRQTVICVTHRLAVVDYCTQVLNMKKHKVSDTGKSIF